MAACSKALPLTASCLSPLPGLESRLGQVRMLPATWGWAVVFTRYSGFLHQLKLAGHDWLGQVRKLPVTWGWAQVFTR